ncbi:MAG: hypothetical protein CO098_11690 [Bacteroidetes bacterium CG_4_9_14_3_um_filter_41_19]|nr:MAG: hypothetical protein CO098_11690 [Bacteroidetes bacterium CG_4_9_14_3_um_filter_41_19]
MIYTKEFEYIIQNEEKDSFIGLGYPNAKILIVGKEVATNSESLDPLEQQNTISFKNNVLDWKKNIEEKKDPRQISNWIFERDLKLENVDNNPLFAFKGTIKKNTSDTWKKYQKLHDIIYHGEIDENNKLELDFQKDFFISEMSNYPSPKTRSAQQIENFKVNLEKRKYSFFKSNFIQQFPIVILACSNYIWNKDNEMQINEIFNVQFDSGKRFSRGEYIFSKNNKFWVHYSSDGKKLVIHTRQLSMNVKNSMLMELGKQIKMHLAKLEY